VSYLDGSTRVAWSADGIPTAITGSDEADRPCARVGSAARTDGGAFTMTLQAGRAVRFFAPIPPGGRMRVAEGAALGWTVDPRACSLVQFAGNGTVAITQADGTIRATTSSGNTVACDIHGVLLSVASPGGPVSRCRSDGSLSGPDLVARHDAVGHRREVLLPDTTILHCSGTRADAPSTSDHATQENMQILALLDTTGAIVVHDRMGLPTWQVAQDFTTTRFESSRRTELGHLDGSIGHRDPQRLVLAATRADGSWRVPVATESVHRQNGTTLVEAAPRPTWREGRPRGKRLLHCRLSACPATSPI